jgi:hypothetical protein
MNGGKHSLFSSGFFCIDAANIITSRGVALFYSQGKLGVIPTILLPVLAQRGDWTVCTTMIESNAA